MPQKPKGPWIHRFSIFFFTIVLAVLIFWVLGFLVQDIESIKGPQYETIEKKHVDQDLVERKKRLEEEIAERDRAIANKRDETRIVSDSSQNLQKTINQLIELQRLAVEKSLSLSETEQSTLADSLSHFLASQKRYQALNAELSDLTRHKKALEAEKRAVEKQIEEQRRPAREEYRRLSRRHDLRLAGLQLLILLPLLAVAAFLVARKRDSVYFPLCLAFGGATLLKVTLVIHKYFPTRYFKYILVIALLIVVARLLVHFIRATAFPKAAWLIRQYREAYERFLCPVCEYPIRRGPRRHLFWTRRTVGKVKLPETGAPGGGEEAYTCPACGTVLFEKCDECQGVRHALLPFCRHCGAEKPSENLRNEQGKAPRP